MSGNLPISRGSTDNKEAKNNKNKRPRNAHEDSRNDREEKQNEQQNNNSNDQSNIHLPPDKSSGFLPKDFFKETEREYRKLIDKLLRTHTRVSTLQEHTIEGSVPRTMKTRLSDNASQAVINATKELDRIKLDSELTAAQQEQSLLKGQHKNFIVDILSKLNKANANFQAALSFTTKLFDDEQLEAIEIRMKEMMRRVDVQKNLEFVRKEDWKQKKLEEKQQREEKAAAQAIPLNKESIEQLITTTVAQLNSNNNNRQNNKSNRGGRGGKRGGTRGRGQRGRGQRGRGQRGRGQRGN